MNILVYLSSQFISEALINYLKREDGYELRLDHEISNNNNFRPDIILTDFNNITPELYSKYPASKVVLIDTGIKKENIITALASYKIASVLSTNVDLRLFKKALNVVSKGQIWIDNSTLKDFLNNIGLLSNTGKINGITSREREVIKCVTDGLRNKDIAARLFMSEQTVKAHLNRIFRKFNVTNRSQLVSAAMNNNIFND